MSSHKSYRLTDPKKFFCFIGIVIVFFVLVIVLCQSCSSCKDKNPEKDTVTAESSASSQSERLPSSTGSDASQTDASTAETSKPETSKPENSLAEQFRAESSAVDSADSKASAVLAGSITARDVEYQIASWSTAVLNMAGGVHEDLKPKVEILYKVVIDPGCGGSDNGNPGKNGVYEKNVNLQVAMKLQKVLNEIFPEIEVEMTRTSDVLLTDQERIDQINVSGADLVISLHCDYFAGDEPRSGIATYYSLEEETDEARQKVINLSSTAAAAVQKQAAAYSDTNDRGTDSARHAILSGSNVPAILVQMAYLTDEEDLKKITDDLYQADMADGLAEGISQALAKIYPNRTAEIAAAKAQESAAALQNAADEKTASESVSDIE